MSKLLIIRGLPGSGKSTLARKLGEENWFHVEADMFFMHDTESGSMYVFDPKKIPQAHDWCQKQAAIALERGDNVVVANTFSRRWEIEPYDKMATALNCDFQVMQCDGSFQNVHNVPQQVIENMKSRWEQYP